MQRPVRLPYKAEYASPSRARAPDRKKANKKPDLPGPNDWQSWRYAQYESNSIRPVITLTKPPIDICLVHALEENPPANAEPVEWFLLTTINAASAENAEQCLRWYTLRWRIEDWHRVLKSGCRIGDLGHESAERLRRAIAINLVIAWRIMLMTLLGRETPDLPAQLLFSDIELRTLHAYAKKKPKTALAAG
ncbi:MAG: transposase [Marinobacter sp.]|nr:transposase [Marinobacter sp.]